MGCGDGLAQNCSQPGPELTSSLHSANRLQRVRDAHGKQDWGFKTKKRVKRSGYLSRAALQTQGAPRRTARTPVQGFFQRGGPSGAAAGQRCPPAPGAACAQRRPQPAPDRTRLSWEQNCSKDIWRESCSQINTYSIHISIELCPYHRTICIL